MAALDHGIKMITDTAGRQLARVAGVDCQRLQPIESTLPRTTAQLADRAFRANRGRERFILYFEFYTRWDPNAPWDMLAKSSFLSQRAHLPTVCLAFVFLRRGFRSSGGQLRLEAMGQPTQQLWFREIPLWEQDPQPWWEEVPGLMALYPLCRHGRTPPEAIRHAVEAIEQRVPEADRREVLALLTIFGELAFPQLNVKGIIGMDLIKDSKLLRSVVAQTQREDVLHALRIRFGEEAGAALGPLLEPIEDIEQLRGLHALAIRCASIDEFRAGLTSPPPPFAKATPLPSAQWVRVASRWPKGAGNEPRGGPA
jgi:hypothetical protein